MAATRREDLERQQLADLAMRLRKATWAALRERSFVAASLDESRTEVERLLMLETIDRAESRRVAGRAQLMLDGWRNMRADGPGGERDGDDDGDELDGDAVGSSGVGSSGVGSSGVGSSDVGSSGVGSSGLG